MSTPSTSAPARADAIAVVPSLRVQHGDATNLEGLSDSSFGVVVSIFGAMFAPRPFDVAKEMVRVTRPGGRIVMGNWIPNDPTLVAQILRISSSYTAPPPEGFVSPMTWGIEANVVERSGAASAAATMGWLRSGRTNDGREQRMWRYGIGVHHGHSSPCEPLLKILRQEQPARGGGRAACHPGLVSGRA